MDYFTSRDGNDFNDGLSLVTAFATVQRGADQLGPGDRLFILEGTYVERVRVAGKASEGSSADDEGASIQILPFEDDVVVIDGAVNVRGDRTTNVFREAGNDDWIQVGTTDEWVSRDPLPRDPSFGIRGRAFGAFLPRAGHVDESSHVRLITHHIPEDLRADNQKFGPMPEEMLPGDPPGFHDASSKYPTLPRRPWVYLGPGVWQDGDDHVHIRLTHTTHESRRVRNYTGLTDPRQLPLAICTELDPTLAVIGCVGVEIRGITVRGGGRFTISIEESERTVLDHVTVLAGPDGVNVHGNSHRTTISHCVVDGGVPPWMFRSDIKDEYHVEETDEQNLLGRQTSNTLFQCAPDIVDLELAFCDLLNGHDFQLAGTDVELHHCYVANVNDDFPYVGTTAENLRVHHNVVEQVRTFVSLMEDSDSGPVRVYRNLVDLRRPVLGRRPHPRPSILDDKHTSDDEGGDEPFDELDLSLPRYGMFLKSSMSEADPGLDVFQNTFLVANQTRVAAYPHFFRQNTGTPRRVFNNIFIAFLSTDDHDKPIVALPLPHASSVTDGNAYLRVGPATREVFFHPKFQDDPGQYDTLVDMRLTDYFLATKADYPPGYEARGIDGPPGFRALAPWPIDEVMAHPEDLRLREDAPARQRGAILPLELRMLDPPEIGPPDIGCYRLGGPPFEVGVDGRHTFPAGPPVVVRTDESEVGLAT